MPSNVSTFCSVYSLTKMFTFNIKISVFIYLYLFGVWKLKCLNINVNNVSWKNPENNIKFRVSQYVLYIYKCGTLTKKRVTL